MTSRTPRPGTSASSPSPDGALSGPRMVRALVTTDARRRARWTRHGHGHGSSLSGPRCRICSPGPRRPGSRTGPPKTRPGTFPIPRSYWRLRAWTTLSRRACVTAWPPWTAPSSGSRAGPTAGPSAAGGRFPRSGWRATPRREFPSKRPGPRRPRPGPETSIDARAGHGPPPRPLARTISVGSVTGAGQHPAQVDNRLGVDVLVRGAVEIFGRRSEGDGNAPVVVILNRANCLQQRDNGMPLDVVTHGMLEDLAQRVAVMVAQVGRL